MVNAISGVSQMAVSALLTLIASRFITTNQMPLSFIVIMLQALSCVGFIADAAI